MKLAKIRQLFEHKQLIGPADEIASLIESKKFQAAIAGKKRIAIGLGSRGISNIVPMVKQLIASLKAAGAEPVIVPAMGSHGTATAEGQIMVLSKLGITEETIGAKIISSMDVILLGKAAMDGKDYEVFIDQAAWQADGVILINRIKTHTDFIATYESGLVKMATVGLGNRKGALQVHSLGTPGLTKLMPALAEVVFADDKFIGGFAIIEDAYHDTAAVHWLSSDEILPKEPELLEESKSLMPYFPIDDIDLLIVKRMGKEISGVGLDPKVLGRLMVWGENELPQPRIELLAICDITDASYGNALGVGLGDFITRRLFERIDFAALKENILTTTFYQRGKTPIVLEDEREIVTVAEGHFTRRGTEKIRAIIVRDTLSLAEMYVSEGVLEQLQDRSDIEVILPLNEAEFDETGTIAVDF